MGGDIDVGTPVWTISHPKGRRAYFSEGVVTEWAPEKAYFKHTIPTLAGSSGGEPPTRPRHSVDLND
jgi:hypothetical protein